MTSAFLDNVISLVGIGLALYAIAQLYAWVSHDSIIKHTVKCKYCRKSISEKVSAYTERLGLSFHIDEFSRHSAA
jgi:large conductance mechanosensitive channel